MAVFGFFKNNKILSVIFKVKKTRIFVFLVIIRVMTKY